jgi:putative ABC transport system substrate-binding protein
MKRREFIAGTAALLVSQRRLRAQGTPRRIGFLRPLVAQPVRDAWSSGFKALSLSLIVPPSLLASADEVIG